MGGVTVGAGGSPLRAAFHGAAMHAVLIGVKGLGALAARFHQEALTMAASAGGGDVGVRDGRLRIVHRHDLMRVAVTINASCGRSVAEPADARVGALRPGVQRVGVAAVARDMLRLFLVSQAGDVLVAVDTGEERSVDGVAELATVHVDAHRLAVDLFGEAWIAMAGEAILIPEFLRGM